MRERERIPRERNQEDQWTVVTRKKPRTHHSQALQTCFINHLPKYITTSDLAKIFRTHGAINNIHIPESQTNPNHLYAFVQFAYPQSLATAIRDENGRLIGKSRITVFPAKYDKRQPPPRHQNTTSSHSRRQNKNPLHLRSAPKMAFIQSGKSFKEAAEASNQKGQPTQKNPSEKTPNTNHTLSKPNPTKHRIMSSRVLGEDTEKIRGELGEIDLESDIAAAMKGKICEENKEWLERSSIAISQNFQSSESILEHILAEGVNNLTIKSMGGLQHLIIFDSKEDKESMIESEWLGRWFMAFKDVDKQSKALWRETWISIHGVPLVAWGYDNFYDIGCVFGKVISVQYKQLDCAYIKVCTDCMFDIHCKISMDVDDKQYHVFVSEKQQQWQQDQKQSQKAHEEVKVKSASENGGSKGSDEPNPGNVPNHEGDEPVTAEPKSHFLNDEPLNATKTDIEKRALENHEQPLASNSLNHSSDHLENIKLTNDDVDSNKWKPNHQLIRSPNHSQSNQFTQKTPEPTQQTFYLDKPTQELHKSQGKRKSPARSLSFQNTIFSPIKTTNTFGPLLRPNKTKASSSSTLGSTSCSGPLFPPGFEESIPSQTKRDQEKRRKRKLERRNKMRKALTYVKSTSPKPSPIHLPKSIQIDDVIQMANTLGLSFDGPVEELERRIGVILTNQKLNWDANLS
uniref:RRM domain-containing protein n=1 Tax=Beta vulgaris subsp. vulgaris TaxID=3555 RepID=F4NCK8_BETVV|nr:hypothetical protein [Beta vulgaris subsp. vulgaris]